jgi:hypothetical protein
VVIYDFDKLAYFTTEKGRNYHQFSFPKGNGWDDQHISLSKEDGLTDAVHDKDNTFYVLTKFGIVYKVDLPTGTYPVIHQLCTTKKNLPFPKGMWAMFEKKKLVCCDGNPYQV